MNEDLIIKFRRITDEIRRITKDPNARPSISLYYDHGCVGMDEKVTWSISTYSTMHIGVSASTPEACIDAFRGIALSADVRLKEARKLRQQAEDLESQAMALGVSAADLDSRV